MHKSAILNRLFGEQIAEGRVADADSIIWGLHVDSSEITLIRLKITSSAYLLGAIRETESFEWDSCVNCASGILSLARLITSRGRQRGG